MFVAFACSGGKSGGKGLGDGSVTLTPTQLTKAMAPSVSYTDAEWATAISSIGTLVRNADEPAASNQVRAQKIIAGVKASPYVFDAGDTGGFGVWIRMKDGTPIGVYFDRVGYQTGDPNPLATPWAQAPAPRTTPFTLWALSDALKRTVFGLLDRSVSSAQAQAAPKFGLPASTTAFIAYINDLGPNAATKISQMLGDHHYQPTGQTNPSMAFFRTGIQNFGVFWFSTHGVYYADSAGVRRYGFITGDIISGPCNQGTAICAANKADIAAGRGFVGMTPSGESGIALNASFVSTYFHFSQDALVFLDACNSMTDSYENHEFWAAMGTAKAGTFVGWTSTVGTGFAEKAATWFFDRVLGANLYSPPTPKQRPFSAPEVIESMKKSGKDLDPGGSARLTFKQLSTNASILRPSIRNMRVDENHDKLKVYGEFGETTGTLEIPTTANWTGWASDLIEADITVNHKGDAIVKVGQRESNVVPLTDWVGTYYAKQYLKFLYKDPGPTWSLACSRIHLRADVHKYRKLPDETPVSGTTFGSSGNDCTDPTVGFENFARDSVCEAAWADYGERVDGNTTTRVTFTAGNEGLQWIDHSTNHIERGWFFMTGQFNTASKSMRLLQQVRPLLQPSTDTRALAMWAVPWPRCTPCRWIIRATI